LHFFLQFDDVVRQDVHLTGLTSCEVRLPAPASTIHITHCSRSKYVHRSSSQLGWVGQLAVVMETPQERDVGQMLNIGVWQDNFLWLTS